MNDLKDVFMEKPTEFVGLRMTKKEKELIKEQAKKENLTYTNVVRKILIQYFEKSENPQNN